MSDDLQQARIEAGAEAMYRRLFPGRMAWLDLPETHRGGWRDRAAEIVAAADAVITVEMQEGETDG